MAVLTSTQELTRQAIAKLRAKEGQANGAASETAAAPKESENVTETTTPEVKLPEDTVNADGTDKIKLTKLVQVMLEGTPLHRPVAEAAHNAKLSPAAWVTQLIARELKVEMPEPTKKAPKTAVEKAQAEDGELVRLVVIRDNFADMVKTVPSMKKMSDGAAAKVNAFVKKLEAEVGEAKAKEILKQVEDKVRSIRHPESK